jgi:hypothetical protein
MNGYVCETTAARLELRHFKLQDADVQTLIGLKQRHLCEHTPAISQFVAQDLERLLSTQQPSEARALWQLPAPYQAYCIEAIAIDGIDSTANPTASIPVNTPANTLGTLTIAQQIAVSMRHLFHTGLDAQLATEWCWVEADQCTQLLCLPLAVQQAASPATESAEGIQIRSALQSIVYIRQFPCSTHQPWQDDWAIVQRLNDALADTPCLQSLCAEPWLKGRQRVWCMVTNPLQPLQEIGYFRQSTDAHHSAPVTPLSAPPSTCGQQHLAGYAQHVTQCLSQQSMATQQHIGLLLLQDQSQWRTWQQHVLQQWWRMPIRGLATLMLIVAMLSGVHWWTQQQTWHAQHARQTALSAQLAQQEVTRQAASNKAPLPAFEGVNELIAWHQQQHHPSPITAWQALAVATEALNPSDAATLSWQHLEWRTIPSTASTTTSGQPEASLAHSPKVTLIIRGTWQGDASALPIGQHPAVLQALARQLQPAWHTQIQLTTEEASATPNAPPSGTTTNVRLTLQSKNVIPTKP